MGLFGGGSATSSVSPTYSSLAVQTSVAGKAITKIYGTSRIAGNLVWYGDFASHAQSGGGGGGKGGGGGSTVSGYTYSASVVIGLCAGPILGVGTVWQDKDAVADGLAGIGASLFLGEAAPRPWGYLTSAYPAQAVSYAGLACVAAANMDLGTSASPPNYNFEVAGAGVASIGADADPAFCVRDILTDAASGAGLDADLIGDLSDYSAWCAALGLGLSPVLDTQNALRDALNDWLDATQAAAVWSGGRLRVVPYADGPVGAYVPDLTPVMGFTDDDYLPQDGDPPVKVTRADPADLYNRFTVEYLDRSTRYNTSTVTSEDAANIDAYGIRAEGNQSWHFLTSATAAQTAADLRRQRILGVLATYEWRSWDKAALLEPMDLVSVTDAALGLAAALVRVTRIEEVDDGIFAITAEDLPGLSVTDRPVAVSAGYSVNQGQTAPDINAPLLFEPPATLTGGDLELWAAVSGNGLWGGCVVYASDDGNTYGRVGTIAAPARQGSLVSRLPAGDALDTTHVPTLSLAGPGILSSGTLADARNLNTLCWVDGELLAYQTATLVGAGLYQLSTLVRGADGTSIAAHAAGAAWCRVDDNLFRYPFDASRIGATLYLKFVSFNIWGGGMRTLAEVEPYAYTLQGTALASAPGDVDGLTTVYRAGVLDLSWQPVEDVRGLDYEVRMGASWASAQVVGRTANTEMASWGDGTYWVAAHYSVPGGAEVYSVTPAEVVVSGSQLVTNVIASHDEAATGWAGALAGVVQIGGALQLAGQGDIAQAGDVAAIAEVSSYGNMAGWGGYTVPAAHRVFIGRVAACQVVMSAAVRGQSVYDDVATITDMAGITDVSGAAAGVWVSARPQLRLSQDGVAWGDWQDWNAGRYSAMAFDFRLLIGSKVLQVAAVVTGFTVAVDVPDRADTTTVTPDASGAVIAYAPSPFNGGPNGQPLPILSVAIVDGGSPGDTAQVSAAGLSGCTVTVYSAAGTAVAGRTVHVIAQGY